MKMQVKFVNKIAIDIERLFTKKKKHYNEIRSLTFMAISAQISDNMLPSRSIYTCRILYILNNVRVSFIFSKCHHADHSQSLTLRNMYIFLFISCKNCYNRINKK